MLGAVIGRSDEAARLSALLADVEIGAGALVVRGPAGIGKTTVVDEALSTVGDRAVVIRTQAIPSEVVFPYGGLVEAVGPLLHRLGALPDPQRGALERVLSLSSAADASPLTVALATLTLLGSRDADGRATLLVLDDAHWLDQESANVLAYAARRAHGRLTMVVVVREDERWDLMGVPVLDVGPLPDAAADRLLQLHAPGLGVHLRAAIRAAADGNPLALVQLPRAVRPTDDPGSPAGLLLEAAQVPHLFDATVDGLDPDLRMALLIAAASGREATSVILDAVRAAGLDPGLLEAAHAAGLVRMDDRVLRFAHPLLRAATLARAPDSVRRRAHTALAAATSGAEQARHRAAAATGPDASIAAALAAAGTAALSQRAFSAACDAFRRAAELTPAGGPIVSRLAQAAAAAQRAGRPQLAIALGTDALGIADDPADRMEVARTFASVLQQSPSAVDANAVRDAILRDAPTDPARAGEALAVMALGAAQTLALDDARRLLDLARQVAGEPFRGTAAVLDALVGDRRAGLELVAGRIPATEGAPMQLLLALERYADLDTWFETTPDREGTFALRRSLLGMADWERGRLALAEQRLGEAHAESIANAPGLERITTAVLARVLAATGRTDGARELLDRTFRPQHPDATRRTARLSRDAAHGAVALTAGRWEDALRDLRSASELAIAAGVAEPGPTSHGRSTSPRSPSGWGRPRMHDAPPSGSAR